MPLPASTYTLGQVISQTTFAKTTDYRGQIEELVEQAKEANKELHKFMQQLSNHVNNESGRPITYTRAPIKTVIALPKNVESKTGAIQT